MAIARLRTVGGSVMVTIPPAILETAQLRSGLDVEVSVEEGRLVMAPLTKPRYTLSELLKQHNEKGEQTPEERVWMEDAPVGREIL
jgi:antitoxin ChpS